MEFFAVSQWQRNIAGVGHGTLVSAGFFWFIRALASSSVGLELCMNIQKRAIFATLARNFAPFLLFGIINYLLKCWHMAYPFTGRPSSE